MRPPHTLIFAKAPQPGLAKTRLIPALGDAGAARLALRLLHRAAGAALAANIGPVELCAAPARGDPAWQGLLVPQGVDWSDQGDGDLGARLARAAERHLSQGDAVILIGSDCPALDADLLRQAATALERFEAVIAPAADGGYALLGLRRFDRSVFSDIAWSSTQVLAQTLASLNALDWSVALLQTQHDIDRPEDLCHLPDHWPEHVSAPQETS